MNSKVTRLSALFLSIIFSAFLVFRFENITDLDLYPQVEKPHLMEVAEYESTGNPVNKHTARMRERSALHSPPMDS